MKNSKIGIIGLGSIGERHYKNLRRCGVRDITVMTRRTQKAGMNTVASWDAFAQAGPYDAILVCNETYKHCDTVKKALLLKPKALFVEKPLAIHVKEVRAIQKAVAKRDIHFFVGYSRQFYKPYQEVKKAVAGQAIGKVYAVRISVGQSLTEWRTRDYRHSYSGKKEQGGGVILDLVHEINFPAWLLEEKVHITSSIVRKVSSLDIDTEDMVEALGESEGGAVISIHLDCVRKPGRWSCEVIGEKGSITWDSNSQTLMVNGRERHLEVNWNDMFVKEMQFFLSLLKKKEYFSNLAEAASDAVQCERIRAYGA